MISDREVDSKGEAILNYEYGYDSFGNITSIRNCLEDGEEISYSSEANGLDAAVTEDGENTVTSISMEYNSANQLIKYNGNEIKYDKNGNMIYGPLDGEMTEVEHFAIPIKVYNFEVEDWHSYAVSEVAVVVHNSKGYVESGNQAKKDSKSKNTKKS